MSTAMTSHFSISEWFAVEALHANLEALAAPYPTCAVRLEAGARVQMRSGVQVKAGKTVPGGEMLFSIPEAFRPPQGVFHLGIRVDGTTGKENVGIVQLAHGGELAMAEEELKAKDRIFVYPISYPAF